LKRQRQPHRTEALSLKITLALKNELLAEAWEEQRTLSDYVFGLLSRRGKWKRSTPVETARYDLGDTE
jgi:hypothetical protein